MHQSDPLLVSNNLFPVHKNKTFIIKINKRKIKIDLPYKISAQMAFLRNYLKIFVLSYIL